MAIRTKQELCQNSGGKAAYTQVQQEIKLHGNSQGLG